MSTGGSFSDRAEAYANSPTHAAGLDLEVLAEFAAPGPDDLVLDVATGPGHTLARLMDACRFGVGIDIAPGMVRIASARGIPRTAFVLARAEALPHPGATFDLVVSRLGFHHVEDPPAGLAEIARVLRPAGRVVIEDSLAPNDPAAAELLHFVEKTRDPTHVRSLDEAGWCDALADAGLRVEARRVVPKERGYRSWAERTGMAAADIEALEREILAAPAALRRRFFTMADGRLDRFTDEKIVLLARHVSSR